MNSQDVRTYVPGRSLSLSEHYARSRTERMRPSSSATLTWPSWTSASCRVTDLQRAAPFVRFHPQRALSTSRSSSSIACDALAERLVERQRQLRLRLDQLLGHQLVQSGPGVGDRSDSHCFMCCLSAVCLRVVAIHQPAPSPITIVDRQHDRVQRRHPEPGQRQQRPARRRRTRR